MAVLCPIPLAWYMPVSSGYSPGGLLSLKWKSPKLVHSHPFCQTQCIGFFHHISLPTHPQSNPYH
jgi:hypothetical protein